MAVQDAPNPMVHKIIMNPGNEERKVKTKLDEVLEEKEARAARRYSAAEMEKMALEAENEAARLRGEPPKYKYGGSEMNEDRKKDEEARRQQLLTSAKALIDSGMEPTQVGQMLLGLTPTSSPPVGAQGMGVDDVLKIVNLVVGKKEADELKTVIASLDKKVDNMAKGGVNKVEISKPLTPMEYAKQQKDYIDALKSLGLIPEKSPPVTEKGEPLEIVKERHRHEERMDEIKADREYKQSLANTASEIPERVGRGIAGHFAEEGEGGSEGGGLETLECSDCHTKIYITPETGDSVTCPKCGAIYSRKETVETQQEK